MRTLSDIVIIAKDPLPCVSKEGIILLPDYTLNEELGIYTGKIKIAGEKCHTLKPGDKVIFHRSQYSPMTYEGENFSVCHESEVLAVIEE